MFSSVSIYLASSSPQRQALLERLGVSYQSCPAAIDETRRDGEEAFAYVLRTAEEKALAAQNTLRTSADRRPILAADTVIIVGGDVFGKPRDRDHARRMLSRLSNSTHYVVTGVVLRGEDYCKKAIDTSSVTFVELSEALIEKYLDTGEYLGKAGAYAIQGLGEVLAERIEGSFSGIMGLPLHTTVDLFKRAGLWNEP